MSATERRLIAEQRKLNDLRARIRETVFLKASEVRAHLQVSRGTLAAIPPEVLPWVPGAGAERVERRYHPADVEAYPARARRWRAAVQAGKEREMEVLAAMAAEVAERDARLIATALGSDAA